MARSVEATIAFVTLLVTGPPSLLLLWNHFKDRNRDLLRGECYYFPSTSLQEGNRRKES